MNKFRYKPTEGELEILQVLWAHGPSSVRFVNNHLKKEREVGYTTTLKIMQIMHAKGILDRDTENRSHIYRALIGKRDTQKKLLKNFIDKTYQGSAMHMVMQALGSGEVSREDLEELKRIIDDHESQNI